LNIKNLHTEYSKISDSLSNAKDEAFRQLSKLLSDEGIFPAVPIESRLKTWSSISEKVQRKSLEIESLTELNDLVGFRIILLFSQDVEKTLEKVSDVLTVVEKQNKGQNSSEDQFGYQSVHCVGYLPESWLSLPTLMPLKGVKVEIQIRTIAQHLWAAASHLLQYKREENIPVAIRRSVHRMSALLEVVDNEFERVLKEREILTKNHALPNDEEFLSVDYVKNILDKTFPLKNKTLGSERYELVIDYFRIFDLDTFGTFKKILSLGATEAIQYDQRIANGHRHRNLFVEDDRIRKGVFLNHGGLAIQCLVNVIEDNDDLTEKSIALAMRKAKTEKRIRNYLQKPTERERSEITDFFGDDPLQKAIQTRGLRFGLSKHAKLKIDNLVNKSCSLD
jgi:putative GTP pyrophosphokinase